MNLCSLNQTQRGILKDLDRLKYATAAQLQYWRALPQPTISKALSFLASFKLVQAEDGLIPKLWRLTTRAVRNMDTAQPSGRRQPSWAVLSQGGHRNQCEIVLRKRYPGFKMLSKEYLFRLGLNPTVREHAGDFKGQLFFILLDDCQMSSDLIGHALKRDHTKNETHCDLATSKNWETLLQKYIVVSTDAEQVLLHRAWIKKKKIDAEVVFLQGLWRYSA